MIPDKFYGDNPRWFFATVVNNVDPEGAGRIQIRIHGIHSPYDDDVPEHSLPWANTLMPPTEGGTSGLTKIPQVQNSALVFGIFLDGQVSQAPLVIGTTHRIEYPSTAQIEDAIRSDKVESVLPGSSGAGGVYTPRSSYTEYRQANGDVDKSRLIIMKWLVTNGYSPIAAAGITGNLEGEGSPPFYPGSDSTKATKGKEKSYGIAQWNSAPAAGARGKKMIDYLEQKLGSADWREDLFGQLQFLHHELRGSVADYYNSDGERFHVGRKLKECTTFEGGPSLDNSTWVIIKYFEAPADMVNKLKQREVYARKAYEQYTSALQADTDNGA